MFKELNSKRTIREGIELTELPFCKLRDLIGKELHVDGFFFTDGGFGRQVVVVAEGLKVNMPARAVSMFEDIRSNSELLNGVLEGHLKITNIREAKAKKGTAVLFDLEDC